MTTPAEFPTVIDSTIISNWRACRQKAFRMYFQHWKPQTESVHLVAGGAFASGVEAARRAFFFDGLPQLEAEAKGLAALWKEYGEFQEPEDSPKGPLRMAGALEYYFTKYPLGGDRVTPIRIGGRLGVEFSFAEPLDVLHPATGDPVLFAGRADMIAEAMGDIYLYDEKTTSQLGPTWSKKWDHRSQFTAYCWGLRENKIKPRGVVVRGVAIYKDSYDTAEAITHRSDWEIDRWKEGVEADVADMVRAWQEGKWRHNLDDSCVAYGGCPLLTVCKAKEPDDWLPMYFTRRRWNPLTRTEETV